MVFDQRRATSDESSLLALCYWVIDVETHFVTCTSLTYRWFKVTLLVVSSLCSWSVFSYPPSFHHDGESSLTPSKTRSDFHAPPRCVLFALRDLLDRLFTSEVGKYAGQYVKDADKALCEEIKANGRLVSKDSYTHSYPFCWRSDTPLIYKAVPSWFVAVESIRDKLLKNNAETYWVPSFVNEKRFQNW